MSETQQDIRQAIHQQAHALRALSIDAVEQANSGHPGMPLGMADIAAVLWSRHLKHNPQNPQWADRDRFILSNGHGSMLLYALLHLTGYDLSLDDLKQFRQLDSKTPGHPEYGDTPGVETSTGPLGQGLANGVGMALAEKLLAAQFNRDEHHIVDHFTYVFAGDGCLMEGVSHEACSLAGTLKLGKLIVFWDDNGISIDGQVAGWFADDTPARFRAYHWQVIEVDGHDPQAIDEAIEQARAETTKPTLICCKTEIGHGSPNKVNTASAHGEPLGGAEIALTKKQLNWQHPAFHISDECYQAWDAKAQGKQQEHKWQELFELYEGQHPQLAVEFRRRLADDLPNHLDEAFNQLLAGIKQADNSTRAVTQQVLEKITPLMPELLGGSADLSKSNSTHCTHTKAVTPDDASGNYINYGVREFAMAAMMNGSALHRGFVPFGGTFLIFCSYAANAIRMSALMHQRVIYVLTHDSIGLGEDGPTHQPVAQLAMLRATPNLSLWRPCDTAEAIIAWQKALENNDKPTCLIMSRQKLPQQAHSLKQIKDIQRGGYVLFDGGESIEAIIMATGSEVALAMAAAEKLQAQGKSVRVVSMPSIDEFEQQDQAYKDSVLPPEVTNRIAVEAAYSDVWYRYVGTAGKVLDLRRFGVSAPGKQAFEVCGFTVDAIVELI
jgi:transketolase